MPSSPFVPELPALLLEKLFRNLEREIQRVSPSIDGENLAADIVWGICRRPKSRQLILDKSARILAGQLPRCLKKQGKSKAWKLAQKQRKQIPLTMQPLDERQDDAELLALNEFIDSLGDGLRQVVLLKKEGRGQLEIARQLGVCERTVRNREDEIRAQQSRDWLPTPAESVAGSAIPAGHPAGFIQQNKD